MGRSSVIAVAAAAVLAVSGCGEPLVVIGDAPGLMRIVLGVGDSVGTRVDSLATRTRLLDPWSLAFDPSDGRLYAADRGALRQVAGVTTRVARIFSVSSNRRVVLLLDAGGCAQGTCVLEPVAMDLAPDGSIIIADAAGHRVLRYVPGGALTVVAGTGSPGTAEDGAIAAESPVRRPAGVAVAADGRIFFSEGGADRVRVIGTDGRLGTVAGNGSNVHGGDGGPATAAGVVEPAGLLLVDDVLYIAESGAHTVRAVDPNGTIRTVAGIGAPGFEGDGGPATAARLDRPFSLAATSEGRTLFISDRGNQRVRAVDLVTGIIRTFAGTGDIEYTGDRQPAGQTSLFNPAGLESGAGFLFITDPGHGVVWRVNLTFE